MNDNGGVPAPSRIMIVVTEDCGHQKLHQNIIKEFATRLYTCPSLWWHNRMWTECTERLGEMV